MNIEKLFIENTTLYLEDIEEFKTHIKKQNLLNWDDIITGMKYVVEEAIKADRINLLEHVKVSIVNINVGHDFEFTDSINIVNKDSIINAPDIHLL